MLEPTTPTPRPRRRRRALVAGASVLAAATAAIAVTAGNGGSADRLSLVSGGTVGDAETARSAAPAAEPAPAAAGGGGGVMSSDAKMTVAPWYQTTYEVDGDLPELGGEGRAWRFLAPDFDGGDAARMAAALGLSGTPTEREGGWVLDSPDGWFSAFPSTDSWSINFNRSEPGPDAAGGEISAVEAEAAARALLDNLGVLEGRWVTEVSETEVGAAYRCASPGAEPGTDTDLREAGHDPTVPVEAMLVPQDMAGREPGTGPAACPPPPAAVSARHVAFYPILDGLRPDWSGWGVTIAAGGEVNSLYGTWTELREAGSYKLRSVDAAFDELRNPAAADGAVRPLPAIAVDEAGSAAAVDAADGTAVAGAESAPTRLAPDAPVSDLDAMPAPDYCDPAADCVPPSPVDQRVTITGVSRTLTVTSVWTDGTVQTHLVPAYRFTGRWDSAEMGDRWETTVMALHPDAIAPPPALKRGEVDAETNLRSEG